MGSVISILENNSCGPIAQASPLYLTAKFLSKTVQTYESELDKKVNFKALQDAIDALGKAMRHYPGFANEEMYKVRQLNSSVRQDYQKSVGLIYLWCTASIGIFDTVLSKIDNKKQSDREIIFKIASDQLKDGLKQVEDSLKVLHKVLKKTSELQNLFESILHDVYQFFTERMDITKPWWSQWKTTISGIFAVVGDIIFGSIGEVLGFAKEIAKEFRIKCLDDWNEIKSCNKPKLTKYFFKMLKEKVNHAKDMTKCVIDALEDDRLSLIELKGKLKSTNSQTELIKNESKEMRKSFAESLIILKEQCEKYKASHENGYRGNNTNGLYRKMEWNNTNNNNTSKTLMYLSILFVNLLLLMIYHFIYHHFIY